MIYLKRILWLLGYPIMWLLSYILLLLTFVFIGFWCSYLYIKTGDTQGFDDYLDWDIKIMGWYNDIEPKED